MLAYRAQTPDPTLRKRRQNNQKFKVSLSYKSQFEAPSLNYTKPCNSDTKKKGGKGKEKKKNNNNAPANYGGGISRAAIKAAH